MLIDSPILEANFSCENVYDIRYAREDVSCQLRVVCELISCVFRCYVRQSVHVWSANLTRKVAHTRTSRVSAVEQLCGQCPQQSSPTCCTASTNGRWCPLEKLLACLLHRYAFCMVTLGCSLMAEQLCAPLNTDIRV